MDHQRPDHQLHGDQPQQEGVSPPKRILTVDLPEGFRAVYDLRGVYHQSELEYWAEDYNPDPPHDQYPGFSYGPAPGITPAPTSLPGFAIDPALEHYTAPALAPAQAFGPPPASVSAGVHAMALAQASVPAPAVPLAHPVVAQHLGQAQANKIYSCVYDGCDETGPMVYLKNHMKEDHEDGTLAANGTPNIKCPMAGCDIASRLDEVGTHCAAVHNFYFPWDSEKKRSTNVKELGRKNVRLLTEILCEESRRLDHYRKWVQDAVAFGLLIPGWIPPAHNLPLNGPFFPKEPNELDPKLSKKDLIDEVVKVRNELYGHDWAATMDEIKTQIGFNRSREP